MLALTAVAVFIWVPQQHWVQFYRDVVASTLYFENWSLANDAVDYLAQENAASPTQHYWTLSVEEQFYLVWPLLITSAVVIAKRRRMPIRATIAVTVVVAVAASLLYSLHLTHVDAARAFFVTPTRAWEFGFGALLAFVPAHALVRLPRRVSLTISSAALVVMVGCGFVLNGSTPMPGTAAIVVVLSAAAFIATERPGAPIGPAAALLANRPVQFTGDISYSLYLWHWPLIVLFPFIQGHPNGNRTLLCILVLTFLLATATTYLVEVPIRSGQVPWLKKTAATFTFAAVGAFALLIPSGAVWIVTDQAEARDLRVAQELTANTPRCFGAASRDPEVSCSNPALNTILVPDPRVANRDTAMSSIGCATRNVGEPIDPCVVGSWGDPKIPKIALIGDSHARVMSSPLTALADQGLIAFDGYFQSGCVWTTDAPHGTRFGRQCVSFKKELDIMLKAKAGRYDLVITTGRISKLVGTLDQKATGLAKQWSSVTRRGTPVVAITDVPEIGANVNECLERVERDKVDTCARNRSAVLPETDPITLAVKKAKHAYFIDFSHYYCDKTRCPLVIGGATVYADSNHLTSTYARTLAPIIYRELRRISLTGEIADSRPEHMAPSLRAGG